MSFRSFSQSKCGFAFGSRQRLSSGAASQTRTVHSLTISIRSTHARTHAHRNPFCGSEGRTTSAVTNARRRRPPGTTDWDDEVLVTRARTKPNTISASVIVRTRRTADREAQAKETNAYGLGKKMALDFRQVSRTSGNFWNAFRIQRSARGDSYQSASCTQAATT
jgi:hypothetical protein